MCDEAVALDADAQSPAAAITVAARTSRALDTDWFSTVRGKHPRQPFVELNLGLPPEQLLRAGDVRAALLRIVDRQRLVDDLAVRAGQPEDGLRKLKDRELAGVADVDRQV